MLLMLCIVEFIFKMAKRRADVALKHETLENYLAPPKFIQRAAAEQLNVVLKIERTTQRGFEKLNEQLKMNLKNQIH